MREALGGALLIYLVIPIIVLMIVFIGFIMNYASAYRAANYVVSQIESCQGYGAISGLDGCDSYNVGSVSNYVKSKYHYTGFSSSNVVCTGNGSNGSYCRVTLPVKFELPVLGSIGLFNVVVETKTLRPSGIN